MTSPVTPQRAHRSAHAHSQSLSYAHARSPVSPATPYTPISLRSFTSSNPPSTLATPASAKSHPDILRHMSFTSPALVKSYTASDNSLADLAQNWRSRANEHGIKVSKGMADASQYDEEDSSFYDGNDSSNYITAEEVLLPPPFLSNHRRRALSQSHAPVINASQRMVPTSPLARKSVSTIKNSVMATPPPNRDLARQLKLKGSFTDPAQTRRREAFGVVSNTPQRNPDLSLDLFDIDENDVEHDYDYEDQYGPAPTRNHEHSLPSQNSVHPHHQQEYTAYNLFNNVLHQPPIMPVFGQPTFADPFMGNTSLPSRMESNFNRYPNQTQHYSYTQSYSESHAVERTQPSTLALAPAPASPEPEPTPVACSVCSRQNPPRLAILVPCKHPLCSACLTSALNIVGEKDMECAVCKQSVEDFKLVSGAPPKAKKSASNRPASDDGPTAKGKSFLDPLFSSPGSATGGLESAFEFERGDSIFSHSELRASTPPPRSQRRTSSRASQENTVLRIDNVPWDITPPTISAWLQQPIERVHVLLDRKGKTMSHAFVEVESEQIAAAILRGETSSSPNKGREDMAFPVKRSRGSVLGKGRRARGVTVTRSSQEELMSALFPTWRGAFAGTQPSLAGMENDRMITALECGVMGESEVTALLYLIRSPDAHFLKVPSLPFHSLISVLSKFPVDEEGRGVFWTTNLRDLLYDAAFTATQVLQSRIEQEPASEEFNETLLHDLLRTGESCRIFTSEQTEKFREILQARNLGAPVSEADSSCYQFDADIEDGDEQDDKSFHTPSSVSEGSSYSEPMEVVAPDMEDLAREFGVEAHLVQALAQRLAGTALR
uniref:Putative zinc finger protein n=1 Tax=Strobilurus tenacellus TaxID=41251 RepID=A0A384XR78_STRTC|nr:putative zinc finger protein [Strobilurus tenacellus]